MRVLFIIPPYKYPHPDAMRTELLGPLYLASALRKAGHEISIYDTTMGPPRKLKDEMYYYGTSQEMISKAISDFKPDVVGISCHYSYSFPGAIEVARAAKNINNAITTIIGGVFVSVYKERVLKDTEFIDYGLAGEAEQSLCSLLSALQHRLSVENIDGLIYRREGDIRTNKKDNFIIDLDSIPYPARDLVDIKKYMESKTTFHGLGAKPALSLLTSRSCPNSCTFCNMHLVHGARWRARTPDNVLGEIDEIVNKYKARHVFIMDDNFTFNTARAKSICEKIIKNKYKFYWNTPNGIFARTIDLELARLMKRAGCANVCIGIESGSEYIRNKVMKKNVSNDEIINAVNLFKKAGIPVGGFVILGMPEETEQYFRESVNFLKRLRLSFLVPTFIVPFPGTKLFDNLVKTGLISSDFQPQMSNNVYPVLTTKDSSVRDLMKRRRILIFEFYMSHVFQILNEFLCGRLNWFPISDFKKIFRALDCKIPGLRTRVLIGDSVKIECERGMAK